jgi:MerR family transcriptional regulator, thiopeptide resistance regulator
MTQRQGLRSCPEVNVKMGLTIGEVARLARISVRTLHHYDRIGLLQPSARTDAGYRLYDDHDLARLQQALFFRELGFALDDIRRIMADPSFDRTEALTLQRRMLVEKAGQIDKMIGAVDAAIDATRKGTTMSKDDMFEAFGDFDPKEYEDEARERWGHTDAYKESTKRAARYTKDDWKKFKEEGDKINADLATLLDAGVPAGDPRAMDAVERHRVQIDTWFYPCSHEMHVNLGEMYIADPRFTATYEKIRPGLAAYVCEAIKANAQRAAK